MSSGRTEAFHKQVNNPTPLELGSGGRCSDPPVQCSTLCTRRRGQRSGQSTGAQELCEEGAGVPSSLQASAQKNW